MTRGKVSRFKGGRRLETWGSGIRDMGYGYRLTGIALLFLLFSVFSPLPATRSPLPAAFADEIKIRAIVTPIGSQSEKWGAAGLMVCVTGEKVENGGCGESGKVDAIDARDTSKTVEIDNDEPGKLVFFVDKDNSHSFSVDAFGDSPDWVYAVKGGEIKSYEIESYAFENRQTLSCPESFAHITEVGFQSLFESVEEDDRGRSTKYVWVDARIIPSNEYRCVWRDVAVGCSGSEEAVLYETWGKLAFPGYPTSCNSLYSRCYSQSPIDVGCGHNKVLCCPNVP